MDFYDRIGVGALGSRLRRLGERLAEDAARVYPRYGTELQPRWLPVFYLLAERGEESISGIAAEIGQSHASVSQIAGEMVKARYAVLKKSKNDKRVSLVTLSARGKAAAPKLQTQWTDVEAAAMGLLDDAGHDLWTALAACERALSERSLYQRVNDQRKRRESLSITVRDFESGDAKAFKSLNERWVKEHFRMEESDRRVLGDPQGEILDKGGSILVAVDEGKTAGVCALLPHGKGCLELTKLAVSPAAQGKGIGQVLTLAAIQRARDLGTKRLFLESNTVLEAAISLYRKLGFVEIQGGESHYERCNIQMELKL
jgi:N-acetylglutamate synthase-like GNAT family acetyltransferase/DNA-binding MarR family transcriptional regulator